MGYCFMSIEKIKSEGQLSSKYKHNYRTIEVENADLQLKYLNKELIKLPVQDGVQSNYNDVFKERINSIDYYKNHKYRKDAVRAYEIVLTFSRSKDIDLESWQQKNVEWLKDTFNVAGDKKDNVVSVVYHGDEVGNVHCHAIVIPIDENERLNAKRFTNGSRMMSQMQSSYAEYMKEFGLERGLQGSSAKHKDIKKYYAELNNAIKSTPEPQQNESAIDYYNRVIDEIQTIQASALKERNEAEKAARRKLDEERILAQKAIQREYSLTQQKIDYTLEQLKKQNQKIKEEYNCLRNQFFSVSDDVKNKQKELEELSSSITNIKDINRKIDFYDVFQDTYTYLRNKEPDKATEIAKMLNYINNIHKNELLPRVEEQQKNCDCDLNH